MNRKVLKINKGDNALVALRDLVKGEIIEHEGTSIKLMDDVPAKHKFLIHDVQENDTITMYGVIVGKTSSSLKKGSLLSTQNTTHFTEQITGSRKKEAWISPDISRWKNRTFLGFHRQDGKVGVANYWLFVPLVFCENRNLDIIKASMLPALGYPLEQQQTVDIQPLIEAYEDNSSSINFESISLTRWSNEQRSRVFPNVDGIKFLNHHLGCGGTRQDASALCELLAGYITNPNVAGATVLGLGCQNAEEKLLRAAIKKRDPNSHKTVYFLEQQNIGSEEELIKIAIKKTFEGLAEANKNNRKPASLSHLAVGLECGGSDGFSGISAHPALGHAADIINALG